MTTGALRFIVDNKTVMVYIALNPDTYKMENKMAERNTRYRTRYNGSDGHELYDYITGDVVSRGTQSQMRTAYKKYNTLYGKQSSVRRFVYCTCCGQESAPLYPMSLSALQLGEIHNTQHPVFAWVVGISDAGIVLCPKHSHLLPEYEARIV